MRNALLVSLTALAACQKPSPSPRPSAAPRVGPENGSVLVVGGGQQGPEIFAKFIELAGGPDALIVEVPTAGGDSIDVSTVGRGLRAAGAKNVVVYHTTSKAVADADSFVARIASARGVWFGGGRHYRLVNSYSGTKSERAFAAVLARGGVVGGSSAGASILASYLIRGAPSNDNRIMNHPDYLTGFGYLRNTAIDQHVVARERLPDLHDSLIVRRRDLLAISEDEGTAWVVRGDTAELMGRGKGFVYNARELTDPGRPFLTLLPGDRFDLGARRVLSRAASTSRLDGAFLDALFGSYGNGVRGGLAVLVARDGKVLLNRAYGVALPPRFTPETAVPLFRLGRMGGVLSASLTPDSSGRITPAVIRRVLGTGGMQRTRYDSVSGEWTANVDDLYRFELGRFPVRPGARDSHTPPAPFRIDTVNGRVRHAVYGTDDGMRGAWVRYPAERLVIMVLSNDSTADVRAMAMQLSERVLEPPQ
ncbi:Type 1 glutamine amidotransferase-like domain-containing protein [Gemmatimonas sp.]|uniref:cyanophycinase n=1 Tax=Gemmatimonas sp. TaxID=1962908 RepID=UPI0025B98A48|nr:Type 1 glutamine amidotransferase-like domain-containing protein [Gemmatimonas sp.]MCA2990652.1 Type 1 glutamine amidotransferase-like domain-containing protein [Gemmatimonas sp.]